VFGLCHHCRPGGRASRSPTLDGNILDPRLTWERPVMDDRVDYRALTERHPDLFRNPPGAAFEILLDEADIRRAEEHMATQLGAVGAPSQWSRVGVAFRDQYVLLLRDAVRYVDGSVGTYIRAVDPRPASPGVVVLPLWRGQVLLIRHFRHATRDWHLEIPRGGGLAPDPRESARRELAEEIGARGARLIELGQMYPDTGLTNSRVALFCAEVASYSAPEAIEGITEILPVPVRRLEEMIGSGELEDGYLLAAYARAKVKGLI
jgi:ADP-ribose pyrophosphatase